MNIVFFQRTTRSIPTMGFSNMPRNFPDDQQHLGECELSQRRRYKLGSLAKDENKWIEMFKKLQVYQQEHDDIICNVPFRFPQNPKHGRWVHKQRQRYPRDPTHGNSGGNVVVNSENNCMVLCDTLVG